MDSLVHSYQTSSMQTKEVACFDFKKLIPTAWLTCWYVSMKNLRQSKWQKSCTEKRLKQPKNTRDVISRRHLKKTSFFLGESPSRPGQGHVYLTDGGLDCCSNRTISFHYIRPEEMYALEYLIYRIRTKWRICENVMSVKKLKINLKTKSFLFH